ncbi:MULTISPECIES: EcsC family protein [Luteimonas]|uniref:EcsC family protein n=1 Tax=Luteimonas TaxID=83614 RepID=UPI000C7C61D6|nr:MULTISPECIES: EcsC family protein [Luteimonas]
MITKGSQDYKDLQKAVDLLESPSLTAQISNLIGTPVEGAIKMLPKMMKRPLDLAVKAAFNKAVEGALLTIKNEPGTEASTGFNKLLAATSGGIGGAFGLPGLLVDLPVSTTIMMRAVVDIARSENFDLDDFETKRACIEVFSMGGGSSTDDAAETGYYMTRSFLNSFTGAVGKSLADIAVKSGKKAGTRALSKAAEKQASTMLAKLIEKVAARFGIVISQKFAAQAVPIIGAVSGAAINTLFTDFYQDMARGHFTVLRLEEKYGKDVVQAQYEKIAGIKK